MNVTKALAFLLAVGTVVQANAAILFFNEPDFEWHQTGGSATPYHIWVTGDYWAQNFQGTGLGSANHMSLSLLFNSATTPSNAQLNLGVFLDGSGIGSFSVPGGVTGSQTFEFSFAPATGQDYRVEIRALNSLPPSNGAVSIALGQGSFVTLVPEPTAIALCSLGLVVFWRRSKPKS